MEDEVDHMRWRMVAAISLVVLVVTSLSGIASKTEVIQKKVQ